MPQQCPHCHVVADVQPHAALGFSCLVCGGPRLALDLPDATLSPQIEQLLTSAGTEQTKHIMYTAAGSLLAAMGALAVALVSGVVVIAEPGALPSLAAYAGAAVPLLSGVAALIGATKARAARGRALRRAQVQTLAELQAQRGPLDAARAAQILRLLPERAELLLAEASVAAWLEEAPAPRLRVATPPAPATVLSTPDDLAEATAPPATTQRGDTEI
ncbi:MAG TPA: hypothetical protein VHB79_24605 [Polyangiaceae bacterium]|nr:hypothetical protein [Polyangiaceae bacterium]